MRLINFFILIFILSLNVRAQKLVKIGNSAKALSMGEANVSLINDVNVMNYNPAGIGMLQDCHMSFMHAEGIADMSYEYFAFAIPVTKKGKAGMNIKYLHYPSFTWYDNEGMEKGLLNGNDMVITVGYATVPGTLGLKGSIGGNIKYLQTKLADYTLQSAAIDFGLIERATLFNRRIYSGAAIRNMGINFQSPAHNTVTVPVDIAAGMSIEIFQNLTHRILTSFELAGDVITLKDIPVRAHTGVEYAFHNFIFIRAGYKYGYSLAGFSAGAGLKFKYTLSKIVLFKKYEISNLDIDLSYGFAPYENFGFIQFFTLNLLNIRIGSDKNTSIDDDLILKELNK